MGYYIEVPNNLHKARQLIELHQAQLENPGEFIDPSTGRVGICVVQNGPFDAAAIIFNKREFEAFDRPDGRPRTWLSLPIDKVLELNPFAKGVLGQYKPKDAFSA